MATPNIVPRADSEGGLGTASKYWASAYIDLIYVGAGKVGRDADNLIDFSTDNVIALRVNATDEVRLSQYGFAPFSSDGLPLGAASNQWSDLYLASGATINFDNGNVILTHSSGALTLADNSKIKLGTGGDFVFFHDGTDSTITNNTGNVLIQNTTDDGDIIFKTDDGSGGTATYFFLDGSAADGTNRYIKFPDNSRAEFGTGTDLQIYHNATNSFISNFTGELRFIQNLDDGDMVFMCDDGSGGTTAYLTLDGSAGLNRFQKNVMYNDNVVNYFGNGFDLQISHDGSNSTIQQAGTGNLVIRNITDDTDVIFQNDDGAGGFTTYFYLDGSSAAHDGSATTALYTNWPDNSYISLGTGHDLQLVHTGVNSVIQSLVGKFEIMSLSDDLEFKQFGNDKDINFSSDDGSGGIATYFRLDGGEGHMIAYKELNFADGVPATFGNTAGGDLEIKEQSGGSYILNNTGNLQIQNHQDDGDIIFKSDDGSGGVATYFYLDGGNNNVKFEKDANWIDNEKALFGTGSDLAIYHNATNSYIDNATGDLYIRNLADDKDIIFQSDDGSGGVETYFFLDGSGSRTTFPDNKILGIGTGTDMYFIHDGTNSSIINQNGDLTIQQQTDDGDINFRCDDGSGALATYFALDGGATKTLFYINTEHQDSIKAQFGDSGDLSIYHNGTNSFIENDTGDLYIRNNVDDKDIIFQSDDGSGGITDYLTLDGSSTGITVSAPQGMLFTDGINAKFGDNDDFTINHDGTNTYLSNIIGDLYIRNLADDKDVKFISDNGAGSIATYFFLDGSQAAHDGSATTALHTVWPDNSYISLGNSSDLKIYHDGSNSYISDTGTGSLLITGANDVNLKTDTNERMVQANANGSVQLFYDNVEKLATSSAGVDVTGSLTPSLGVTKPIASAAANVAAAVAGSIYTFSDTDGAVVTLPDSGGGGLVGQTFEFVCTATATSNSHKVIFSDTTNEKFIGRLTAIDTDTDNTQLVYVPATANKAIVMNGTTTGITGSRFTITNVAADIWMIEGYVHHTGNTANPFANS